MKNFFVSLCVNVTEKSRYPQRQRCWVRGARCGFVKCRCDGGGVCRCARPHAHTPQGVSVWVSELSRVSGHHSGLASLLKATTRVFSHMPQCFACRPRVLWSNRTRGQRDSRHFFRVPRPAKEGEPKRKLLCFLGVLLHLVPRAREALEGLRVRVGASAVGMACPRPLVIRSLRL